MKSQVILIIHLSSPFLNLRLSTILHPNTADEHHKGGYSESGVYSIYCTGVPFSFIFSNDYPHVLFLKVAQG